MVHEQAYSFQQLLKGNAHSVERDKYGSGLFHDPLAFVQNQPDLLFIAHKVDNARCENHGAVASIFKWHPPGVRTNQRKPTADLRVPNHLGAEINSFAVKTQFMKFRYNQALASAHDQDGFV